MMTRGVRLVVFALCVIAVGIVHATDDPQPFTASELDRFLEDWPRFAAWAEERGEALDSVSDPSAFMRALAGMEADSFLRSRGWEPERFFYVAGHTWMALLTVEAEAQAPEMTADIDEAIEEIRRNPRMSAAQKEPAIRQLEEIKAMLLELDSFFAVPAEELELVRARHERVREALEVE